MCRDIAARIKPIKMGSGKPTIPPSSDHRNGDWSDTDIYEGELYMDTDTGVMYTRGGSGGVSQLTMGGLLGVYKANISQLTTNDPYEEIVHVNTLGVVTWTRDGAGAYIMHCEGAFVNAPNVQITSGYNPTSGVAWQKADDDNIFVYTNDDNLLYETSIVVECYFTL